MKLLYYYAITMHEWDEAYIEKDVYIIEKETPKRYIMIDYGYIDKCSVGILKKTTYPSTNGDTVVWQYYTTKKEDNEEFVKNMIILRFLTSIELITNATRTTRGGGRK